MIVEGGMAVSIKKWWCPQTIELEMEWEYSYPVPEYTLKVRPDPDMQATEFMFIWEDDSGQRNCYIYLIPYRELDWMPHPEVALQRMWKRVEDQEWFQTFNEVRYSY